MTSSWYTYFHKGISCYHINISSIINMLHPFCNGSVCALYLCPHIFHKTLFKSLVTLSHWYPKAVVQNLRWLFIEETYISSNSECGCVCVSRFIIPTTRAILFHNFSYENSNSYFRWSLAQVSQIHLPVLSQFHSSWFRFIKVSQWPWSEMEYHIVSFGNIQR